MTKCARPHENKIIEFLADSVVIAKVKSGGRFLVRHIGRSSIMAARERYHRDEELRERGLRKAKVIELQNI